MAAANTTDVTSLDWKRYRTVNSIEIPQTTAPRRTKLPRERFSPLILCGSSGQMEGAIWRIPV